MVLNIILSRPGNRRGHRTRMKAGPSVLRRLRDLIAGKMPASQDIHGLGWVRRVIAFVMLTALTGCAIKGTKATLPEAPPAPLTPYPLLGGAPGPCQAPDGTVRNVPADMVVFYVGSGRNFNEEAGPDGYVLRVAFLNEAYQAVKIERGILKVCLLTSPREEPWMWWEADADKLAAMWIPSRLLDGYMLRLGWGTMTPPRGDYIFRVYYYPNGSDAPAAYCRSVFCQDYELRAAELPAAEAIDAPQ